MNNDLENKEIDNSTSFEVKEGFFAKLLKPFRTKALPSGEQSVRTTGLSINALNILGNARGSVLKAIESVQNFFSSRKNAIPENTLVAHVIGDNSNEKADVKSVDDIGKSQTQPTFVIPQRKDPTVVKTNPDGVVPDGVVIMAETQIDMRKTPEEALSIEAAELHVDETLLETSKQPSQTIQAVDMNVANPNIKTQESTGKDHVDSREQEM